MLPVKLTPIKRIISTTVVLWILTLVAVLFIDKPLALFIHSVHGDTFRVLRYVTELPIVLTIIVIGVLLFSHLLHLRLLKIFVAAYFYITLMISSLLKIGLKITFGRYWPETWINNNLSLIHDGVFGFNWWHGFHNQGSFPSGHTTYITFCIIWLWFIAPKIRWLWSIIGIMVILSLITLDYHFLGDCLAGISLGYMCGYLSLYIINYILKAHPNS